MMANLSRREFVALSGATAGATLAAGKLAMGQSKTLTAGEIVDRIKQNLKIPWQSTSFRDTFKIGGPDVQVKGIATTFGANLSVMQRALKAGLNMIITHEPTFWSDADLIDLVKDDWLYKYKLDYATKNNIVVWRCHDHAHSHQPDLIWSGWNKSLGWDMYTNPGTDRGWTIPPITLKELALYLDKNLPAGTKSIRVIGDPNLRVSKVISGRNLTSMAADADCVVCSDSREYDCYEYARDAYHAGIKRGYIYTTHEASEDAGMMEFANWMKPFVTEIPVQYVPTTDEFWSV